MKKIITKRKNGTLRVQLKPEGKSMTDQSDKAMCDINKIMHNYVKTGVLPNIKEKIGQYLDVTKIPSYIEAHAQITLAKELFLSLPSEVRKLMDNDPGKMEQVINNPDYKQIMLKHGLIEEIKNTNEVPPIEKSANQNDTISEEKKTEA